MNTELCQELSTKSDNVLREEFENRRVCIDNIKRYAFCWVYIAGQI